MQFAPPPAGYRVLETNERVASKQTPELLTRFRWRADRRRRKLNESRVLPSYRWEVVDWLDGRWAVVAMQNRLVKDDLRG